MSEAVLSPLHAAHRDAGARFRLFAGWRLPVHYGSILAEARAVRGGVGMFDVSHMGRFALRGPGAVGLLQYLGTNDLGRIGPGRAQYTLWCEPGGGVLDDLIVGWMEPEELWVVVNAARRQADWEHLGAHAASWEVTVTDETRATAMIAVQGPRAVEVASSLGDPAIAALPRFGVGRFELAGSAVMVWRTGYTGEDGVEIICQASAAVGLWEALRAAGAVPCGLGARDALRLEMGYPLYGHELSVDVTPFEAGLGFAVALDKPSFVGKEALASRPPRRRLAGFVCRRPCVPAPGDRLAGGFGEGVVTSGGTSVTLRAPVGLAFLPPAAALPAEGILRTRCREVAVEVRTLPLIERRRPAVVATPYHARVMRSQP